MNSTSESPQHSRRRALRDILLYGLCGGVLILILKLTEYRFLVVEHSVEIYGALIASLFAALGIWLGLTLTRKKPPTILSDIPAQPAEPFVLDEARLTQLAITPASSKSSASSPPASAIAKSPPASSSAKTR